MTRTFRSSAARICSEVELREGAAEIVALALAAFQKDAALPRVLFKGPMGAGKSSLARLILDQLGIDRASEGSPTFAIAHEYRSGAGFIAVHADGYRLRGDAELEETGLLEVLWDAKRFVLFEWMELFPETQEALLRSDLPLLEVELEFTDESPLLRRVTFKYRD